ncbi:MAG: NfeD family protein [Paucibacter sp.]|nr:NfeD family protein [Roseateles sp.]
MSPSTLWWIACGALVAAELVTGTFYLLMLASGAAAAAVAAWLGAAESAQFIAAAAVGGGAVLAWHRRKNAQASRIPAGANPDVSLDIGQTVHVTLWAGDGSATVKYRGADWQARFIGAGAPQAGSHTIRAIEGSTLLLDR